MYPADREIVFVVNITERTIVFQHFSRNGTWWLRVGGYGYMLATILKSPKATQATFDIIEAFEKLTELQEIVAELPEATDEKQQKSLVQRGGEILSDLIGNRMDASEEETTFEINLAMVKFRRTVKKKRQNQNQ